MRPPSRLASSTSGWSTRRRPAASSIASTATRSRRCCGRRSPPVCLRAGCSRWPPGWWSSVNVSAWPSSRPATGTSQEPSTRPGSARHWSASTVAAIARGSDFDDRAQLKKADVVVLDEGAARSLADSLAGVALTVRSVEEKPYRRSPAAPFITSTLQQEASRKLRMTAQTAMRVAQRLYENGYITYMRTDSTTLSATAVVGSEVAGHRAVRRRPRQRQAAFVGQEGQERAGGARGRPPGRRRLPHSRRARRRAVPRRAEAVRADLEAHAGVADVRCSRHHDDRALRRRRR